MARKPIADDVDGDENEFGAWVQQQRFLKEWSQLELADKSGISQPQISNIEAGRSPNPRPETKEKLYSALGSKPSRNIITEIAIEARIEGVGELLNFDPYNATDLPNVPGVYVFYDLTDRPVYVGQGQAIAKRVGDHEDKFWFKRPIVQSASYVQIDDEVLRKKIEKVLIKFLKSNALINKTNVER